MIGGRSSKGTIKGMFAKIAKRKAEEASSGNTKKAKVHLTDYFTRDWEIIGEFFKIPLPPPCGNRKMVLRKSGNEKLDVN